jgi:hypothetical protein
MRSQANAQGPHYCMSAVQFHSSDDAPCLFEVVVVGDSVPVISNYNNSGQRFLDSGNTCTHQPSAH